VLPRRLLRVLFLPLPLPLLLPLVVASLFDSLALGPLLLPPPPLCLFRASRRSLKSKSVFFVRDLSRVRVPAALRFKCHPRLPDSIVAPIPLPC
jgi:hypothetical protein